jgi:transcriptional regulator with XRE-family HTH domain
MEVPKSTLLERNREIGRIVREARKTKGMSISTCTGSIGTSRRRYVAMEAGEAMIGIAELESLMRFLDIPAERIWPGPITGQLPSPVILQARPGERLYIVIQPKE